MERIYRDGAWLGGWTIAGAIGLWSTVGLTVLAFTEAKPVDPPAWPPDAVAATELGLLFGGAMGLAVGGLQALLLHLRRPGGAAAWIAASAVGGAFTVGAGAFALCTWQGYYLPHPAVGIALLLGCFVAGCAQAAVLARRTKWAMGWPFLKLGAFGVGILAVGLSVFGADETRQWILSVAPQGSALFAQWGETVATIHVVATPALLYGFFTGLPLLRLGQGARRATPSDRSWLVVLSALM
jgi:hypothetical protein